MTEFRAMRRRERQISKEEAIRLLQNGEYGVLATFGDDGWPYGVPLSYVYEDGKLYFHCAREGHKLDNLRSTEKASFTVVGNTHVLQEQFSTAYESVIAFGVVKLLPDKEKVHALLCLAKKYCYDYPKQAEKYAEKAQENVAVYCMEILHLTGKKRPEG